MRACFLTEKSAGCPLTICPRFLVNEPCRSLLPLFRLECFGDDVTRFNLLELGDASSGQLHDAIGKLTNLLTFSLQNGSLTALPQSFTSLTKLENLMLHDNQLGSLPFSLARFTALRQIYLNGNPMLAGSLGNLTALSNLTVLQLPNTRLSGAVRLPASVTICNMERTLMDCSTVPTCSCTKRLANDDCDGAFNVTSSAAVVTINATTCDFCGSCPIANDVWFAWKVPCTGDGVVDACGPTRAEVEVLTKCPAPNSLSMNRNVTCGECKRTFAVRQNDEIRIRASGPPAASISVRCLPPTTLQTRTPTTTAMPTLTKSTSGVATSSETTTAALPQTSTEPVSSAPLPSPTTSLGAPEPGTSTLQASSTTLPSSVAPATSLAAPEPGASPLNVGLIAGVAGGVGGLLLMVLIAIVVTYLLRRKPRTANHVPLRDSSASAPADRTYARAPPLYDSVPPQADTLDSQYSAPPSVLMAQQ